MTKIKISKSSLFFILIAVSAIILFPTHPANAGWLAEWTIEHTFGYVLFLVMSIAGNLIGAMATLLNWVIHIPVYPDNGIAVIDESWKIMRNFANMFFILALIMMAFATIFDVLPGAAKYNARALFGKFLFTALLINFSLVLGVMVIQGTQVVSNTFLTAIGDMANRLGQDLNPSELFTGLGQDEVSAAVSLDGAVFGTLSTLIFSIVLIFTYLFSILTALIFAFIRIPILWALLIVSPIAWIMNIFPAGEGTFKRWWSTFIGWNLFLPIYLFFLYFGLYFLSNQKNIIQSIASEVSTAKIGESLPFSLQLVFFYAMTAIFMIGGTIVAMKASMFSGTGVVGMAKWARGRASRWTGLTGANQAWQEKRKEIEGGEGRLGRIFGGPPAGLETSRRIFGVRGGDIKTQKEFVQRAGQEFSLLQDQYDTGKINVDQIATKAGQMDATNPQGYAYRKMAAKFGRLDDGLFESTLRQLSNNPYAAQDFAKTAKDSKFSNVGSSTLIQAAAGEGSFRDLGPNVLPARREMYGHIQTNGALLSNPGFGQNQFNTGLQIYGGNTTAEGKTYLENISKSRPDLVIDYNRSNPQIMQQLSARNNGVPPSRSAMFDGYLKDAKDIANLPKSVWGQDDFKQALQRKLTFGSPKAQRNFRNRIIDNLRTAMDSGDKQNILNTLQGARDNDQTPDEDILGDDDLGLDNELGNPPPVRGPTPPRTNNVSPNNVVDLRQGERRSPGGIILTPGAQAEIERERRNNP